MSQIDRKISLRKQASGAVERITQAEARIGQLEATLQALANGIQNALKETDKRLTAQLQGLNEGTETINGILDVVGQDEVTAVINEKRLTAATAMLEAQKQSIAEGTAQGSLLKVDTVGPQGLLLATELRPDGIPIPPGAFVIAVIALEPKYRDALVGKPVGTSIDIDGGGRLTVLEAYDYAAPKPAEAAPVAAPVAVAVVPEPAAEAIPVATAPVETPAAAQ